MKLWSEHVKYGTTPTLAQAKRVLLNIRNPDSTWWTNARIDNIYFTIRLAKSDEKHFVKQLRFALKHPDLAGFNHVSHYDKQLHDVKCHILYLNNVLRGKDQ